MRMIVNGIEWTFLNGGTENQTGMIPHFLHALSIGRAPVADQFHANYEHGGGWRPHGKGKWEMRGSGADLAGWNLKYPGDPALKVRAMAVVGAELVLIFDYGLVCVRQLNGSFEVARMD